ERGDGVVDLGDGIDFEMGGHARLFRNSRNSTATSIRIEQRKMNEPTALVCGLRPPRSMVQMTIGKVTSKRVTRKAMMNSSQESVKQRQKAATRAGAIIGMVTWVSTRKVEAPRSLAAHSI